MKKSEIKLEIKEDVNLQSHLLNLKDFLNKQSINGLDDVDFSQKKVEEGHMAIGEFLSSLTAIISAANSPLTELVKCLQIYIQSFRTAIEVKVGESVVKIESKNPEDTDKIVSKILTALNKDEKKEK